MVAYTRLRRAMEAVNESVDPLEGIEARSGTLVRQSGRDGATASAPSSG